MTAVCSIIHIPEEKEYDTFCFEHHETISTEQSAGNLRSAEWCDYLAHELCDPRPDDDPDTVRLMRRGKPPPGAIILFEFFVTPVKTPYGIGFVSDYRQGRRICPPAVASVAMDIYADIRKWIKMQNTSRHNTIGLAPKKERDKCLRYWQAKLYSAPDITYVSDGFDYTTADPVAELLGKDEKA